MGSDRDEIVAKVRALATASQQLGEKVYADVQSHESNPDAATGAQGSRGAAQDEDVIDADFREVKKTVTRWRASLDVTRVAP